MTESVKIIDSSPIFLNLNLFNRADETIRVHGIKWHVMYDLSSTTPTYFEFSNAKTNDIEKAKNFEIISNTTYVMDRAYMDFNWWHDIDEKGAYFVTRLKRNNSIKELTLIQEHTDIVSSQLIQLNNKYLTHSGKNRCSDKILRRVIVQREGRTPLISVTNDLNRSSEEIAELYKQHWQILLKLLNAHACLGLCGFA